MTLLSLYRPRAADPPLPPMAAQLRHALAAAARLARAASAGDPLLVSQDVAQSRLAACLACNHYRASDARCALCGCCLGRPLLDKLKLATESCPASPPRWA